MEEKLKEENMFAAAIWWSMKIVEAFMINEAIMIAFKSCINDCNHNTTTKSTQPL